MHSNPLLPIIIILLTVSLSQAQITSNWTSSVNGDWDDSANWDTVNFPNNMAPDEYDVVIDVTTGSGYFIFLGDPVAVNSLTLDSNIAVLSASNLAELTIVDTLDINNGELFLSNADVIGGTVNVHNSGMLNGSGNFIGSLLKTVGGALNVGNGFSSSQTLRFFNGGNFEGAAFIGGGTSSNSSMRFEDDTTLADSTLILGIIDEPGDLYSVNSTLTIADTSVIMGFGSLRGGGGANDIMINQGTISADMTDKELFINLDSFVNDVGGIVEATNGGRVQFGQNSSTFWHNDGVIRVEDGSTIQFDGDFSSDDIGTIERIGDSTIQVVGDWDNTNNFTLDSATGDFQLSNTSTITGGTLTLNGGQLTGGGVLDGVLLDATNGGFNIGDGASTAATVRLRNGANFIGDAIVSGGSSSLSTMRFDTTDQTLNNNFIRLGNTMGTIDGAMRLDSVELTLASTVVVAGQVFFIGNSSSSFINQGTVTADVDSRSLILEPSFINEGIVSAENGGILRVRNLTNTASGIVRLNGGTIRRATSTPSFELAAGRLEGNGVVDDDIEVPGATIAPGFSTGLINFDNDLECGAACTIEIEIAAADDFDQIIVEGDWTVAGILDVQLIDGYEPCPFESFIIGDAQGAVSGQFNGLSEGDIAASFGNINMSISYVGGDGNDIVLTAEYIVLYGDANLDGAINLLDVQPFVNLLSNGDYLPEADFNNDGNVNLLDVAPFVDSLACS